ncbi:NAD(P)-dependent dehydrogenase (short-subunit alcohol dehydrogenase family) [Leifsonia sp. AK011]|uniref:SDR family NAD(P)-dependent oxidoreductase n=1 Tax=Leifsonia sp. AK011 TaxID=2723075 RepID=UPI0015CA34B8|nr:SDR family NAD(P)-dependent oxidoreductase [Leifsonia sp. AK011]NYF11523.1 NAD(P)-dependent dehydrogenase (short-subunit alcohol dehydrogenase family) [Leifsonia sp. AK011]
MTWDPEHLPDLRGRVYAVTGATAGIGYFAAEQLAAAGAEVVLASRSAAKIDVAADTLRHHVPGAVTLPVTIDLASLDSVAAAADELAALPRLDGILLNGGPMELSARAKTVDSLPLILGAHTVANVALLARLLPALASGASARDSVARVVHTSTGFVGLFPTDASDLSSTPRIGVRAYTKAKTVTEIFAFELDRRLRAAGLPVASIVTRPGVGVDAKTPERAGIRDSTVPYRRNPYTPWAQGKDSAAWSGVRALVDPSATGGQYYAPREGRRGVPVAVEPYPHTADPDPELATRLWRELEQLAGVSFSI